MKLQGHGHLDIEDVWQTEVFSNATNNPGMTRHKQGAIFDQGIFQLRKGQFFLFSRRRTEEEN